MPNAINPQILITTAMEILVSDLEGHGNVLSTMHRSALLEIIDTCTGYVTGHQRGRQAFGLPTGMGKTSAIVAFIAASELLGYQIAVSVAASKVEALCDIKRSLMAHGVPEDAIGIKHSVHNATEPSTGNESRRIQLVTHARVRGGTDFALFGEYQGEPRVLMIYDETLLRSDSFAFAESDLRKALKVLEIDLEGNADPLSISLLSYLQEATQSIAKTLADLRLPGADEYFNGKRVDLPFLDEPILDSYRNRVKSIGSRLGTFTGQLDTFLSVCQDSLQVLRAEQGGGVVAVCEAIPPELKNVVILDASTPIRELVHLDRTVKVVQSFAPEDLKSFEAVEVHQLLASGGRSAIEGSLKQKSSDAAAISMEIIDIIKANEGTTKAFLIFSFLPRRGQVDVLEALKRDLAVAGIDLNEEVSIELKSGTTEKRPRFNFLTWGSQESLNGFEYCDVVIMAGVLHRSHIEIAAAVKAQVGHLPEPTPSDRLRQVIESEIAHVVYQGASRGSCRRINNGKALGMRLYLVHRSKGLKTILDRVMPRARWYYPDPKHLKKSTSEGRSTALLGQVLAYLDALPEAEIKVSATRIKRSIEVGTSEAEKKAFGRSLELIEPAIHAWGRDGRGLIRMNGYGFTPVGENSGQGSL